MTETSDLLAELYEDGHEITLPDGRVLKLTMEYDQESSINDYECYGRVWWEPNDPNTGWSRRAPGFGPHARILDRDHHGRGYTLWWEPLPEIWGTPKPWGPGTFDADFATARRLHEEGFQLVILTLYEDLIDSYGETHRVEVTSQAIGGVDTEDPSYINQIARDLAYEMDVDA